MNPLSVQILHNDCIPMIVARFSSFVEVFFCLIVVVVVSSNLVAWNMPLLIRRLHKALVMFVRLQISQSEVRKYVVFLV